MRAFALPEIGVAGSVQELPDPSPGEGQVRVRVEAAGVNPADVGVTSGAYKAFMEYVFPLVPGNDLAGTVDALGAGVDTFKVGDRVFGTHGKFIAGAGSFAESVIATPASIALRHDDLDPTFAAILPLAGVSALQLVEVASPKQGDVVVVVGATGGIGSIALQLLHAAGARSIAVTKAVNHEYARALGATETIDYETQDVVETVRAAHADGLNAVIDLVGDGELNGRLAELVRTGGNVASMMGAVDVEALAARGITGTNVRAQVTTERLQHLGELVARSTIKRPEIATFPLADAGLALDRVGTHHVRGKLVVVP